MRLNSISLENARENAIVIWGMCTIVLRNCDCVFEVKMTGAGEMVSIVLNLHS